MEKKRILEVKDLRVTFHTYAGDVQAVRGVSWYLNEKETIAIVGESGCGKTVSIQTVIGLNSSRTTDIKGEVLLDVGDGKSEDLVKKNMKEIRKIQGDKMSIIFQDPFTFLNPTMTVGKQIMEAYREHRKVTKKEARERTLKIMRLISFPDPEKNMKCYPHQLSGGMRQRVMVAMALICDPKLLFADEPTTALDVTIQAQIVDLMKELKTKIDTSIVLITHDMGVVANMAERIYVMYAGQIVEHGTAEQIFYEAKHPYTRALLAAVPRMDSDSDAPLSSIPGTPPDLIAPPAGCAFAERCPYAMNICRREQPAYTNFGGEHVAACWLCHPQCPRREGGEG